jgi:hypothetical protein
MTRTRIGIAAALIGTGMLGTLSAAGWREPYALPARTSCDLARGFGPGALLEAARPRKVAESDAQVAAAMQGLGGNPVAAMRHGNLGAGSVMSPLADLNGPQTASNPNRGAAPER